MRQYTQDRAAAFWVHAEPTGGALDPESVVISEGGTPIPASQT